MTADSQLFPRTPEGTNYEHGLLENNRYLKVTKSHLPTTKAHVAKRKSLPLGHLALPDPPFRPTVPLLEAAASSAACDPRAELPPPAALSLPLLLLLPTGLSMGGETEAVEPAPRVWPRWCAWLPLARLAPTFRLCWLELHCEDR